MLRGNVEINLSTFKSMLDEHNLGDAHVTLVGGEKWYPENEQRQRRYAANAELERLGLARGGRLDSDWLDTVNVLQRAGSEFYTWANLGDKSITIRTALSGREGVIAISNGEKLYLRPSRPEAAAFDFAAQLPATPPARIHSVSCAEADYEDLMTGKVPPESSPRDAKQIMRWMKEPRQHVGRLYVAVRDSAGRRQRTQKPPFWIDIEAGRLLLSADAHGWISLSPATPHDVANRLQQMEAQLRGR